MITYKDFLQYETQTKKVSNTILFTEYFTPSSEERDNEFKFCLSENLKNDLISKIVVFISDESQLTISSEKIQIEKLKSRPTYKYIFDFCNQNFNNQVCIIGNCDIVFDEKINILKSFDFNNIFCCLTRWDFSEENKSWQLFPEDWGSQDSWIFKTPIRYSNDCNFLMGKPGCDSRIAHVLHNSGYSVRNPSKQIITKHYHKSNFRTYNAKETVPGPYLLVYANYDINTPSKIRECKMEK